jgi:hypothetical protein
MMMLLLGRYGVNLDNSYEGRKKKKEYFLGLSLVFSQRIKKD